MSSITVFTWSRANLARQFGGRVETAGLRRGTRVTHGRPPIETDLLVASLPAAISRFVEAGGKVIAGPFEIRDRFVRYHRRPVADPSFSIRRKGFSEPMQKGISLRVVPPNTSVLATLRVQVDHLTLVRKTVTALPARDSRNTKTLVRRVCVIHSLA
jgi:hypothetical protein